MGRWSLTAVSGRDQFPTGLVGQWSTQPLRLKLPRTTLHIRTKVLSAISSAGIGLRATLSLHMLLILDS